MKCIGEIIWFFNGGDTSSVFSPLKNTRVSVKNLYVIDCHSMMMQSSSLPNATVDRRNRSPLARPSWTRMSSQRGFRSGASCQISFGACLTDGEQTDVSLASRAARVASFVHCRTRGCEATRSRFYRDLCRSFIAPLIPWVSSVPSIYFIQHPLIFQSDAPCSYVRHKREETVRVELYSIF